MKINSITSYKTIIANYPDNKFDIYIKLQADEGVIERPSDYEEQFLSICKSGGEFDTSTESVDFSFPQGWNNSIAQTQYSIYNKEVPTEAQVGNVFLSISKLQYDGDSNKKIEMNYNRWRKL